MLITPRRRIAHSILAFLILPSLAIDPSLAAIHSHPARPRETTTAEFTRQALFLRVLAVPRRQLSDRLGFSRLFAAFKLPKFDPPVPPPFRFWKLMTHRQRLAKALRYFENFSKTHSVRHALALHEMLARLSATDSKFLEMLMTHPGSALDEGEMQRVVLGYYQAESLFATLMPGDAHRVKKGRGIFLSDVSFNDVDENWVVMIYQLRWWHPVALAKWRWLRRLWKPAGRLQFRYEIHPSRLIIEDAFINEPYQGLGLGPWVVSEVLKQVKDPTHIWYRPDELRTLRTLLLDPESEKEIMSLSANWKKRRLLSIQWVARLRLLLWEQISSDAKGHAEAKEKLPHTRWGSVLLTSNVQSLDFVTTPTGEVWVHGVAADPENRLVLPEGEVLRPPKRPLPVQTWAVAVTGTLKNRAIQNKDERRASRMAMLESDSHFVLDYLTLFGTRPKNNLMDEVTKFIRPGLIDQSDLTKLLCGLIRQDARGTWNPSILLHQYMLLPHNDVIVRIQKDKEEPDLEDLPLIALARYKHQITRMQAHWAAALVRGYQIPEWLVLSFKRRMDHLKSDRSGREYRRYADQMDKRALLDEFAREIIGPVRKDPHVLACLVGLSFLDNDSPWHHAIHTFIQRNQFEVGSANRTLRIPDRYAQALAILESQLGRRNLRINDKKLLQWLVSAVFDPPAEWARIAEAPIPLPVVEIRNTEPLKHLDLKIIFFDFDGTLMAKFPIHREALAVAEALTKKKDFDAGFLGRLIAWIVDTKGTGWRERWNDWRLTDWPRPADKDTFVDSVEIAIHDAIHQLKLNRPENATPGSREFMEEGKALMAEMRYDVVTAAPAILRRATAAAMNFLHLLTGFHGDGQKADVMNLILQETKLGRHQGAIVGDGRADMAAGKKAKILSVGFAETPADRDYHLADPETEPHIIFNGRFPSFREFAEMIHQAIPKSTPPPETRTSHDLSGLTRAWAKGRNTSLLLLFSLFGDRAPGPSPSAASHRLESAT